MQSMQYVEQWTALVRTPVVIYKVIWNNILYRKDVHVCSLPFKHHNHLTMISVRKQIQWFDFCWYKWWTFYSVGLGSRQTGMKVKMKNEHKKVGLVFTEYDNVPWPARGCVSIKQAIGFIPIWARGIGTYDILTWLSGRCVIWAHDVYNYV